MPPKIGADGQTVIDRLLATAGGMEPYEHDEDGRAVDLGAGPATCCVCSASTPPRSWTRTSAARRPTQKSDNDAEAIAKFSDELDAHFCLRGACADADLTS